MPNDDLLVATDFSPVAQPEEAIESGGVYLYNHDRAVHILRIQPNRHNPHLSGIW